MPSLQQITGQFFMRLFSRSWIALVSFRRIRGLMVFFPFLKLRITHSATLALRERSFVENCWAPARISSRYFGSTTLSYSRKVSFTGSRTPASDIIDKSGPLVQRVKCARGSLVMADNFIVDLDPRWNCAVLYWNSRLGRSEFSLLNTSTSAGQIGFSLCTVEPWCIARWVWSADWHSKTLH